MKRPIPIFPILFAAFPVLACFVANVAIVPLQDLWRPLGIAIGAIVAVWIVGAALFRSLTKGALLATVGLVLLFAYLPIRRVIDVYNASPIEPIVLVVVVVALFRCKRDLGRWVSVLNFGSIVLVILPLFSLFARPRTVVHSAYLDPGLTLRSAPFVGDRPDIYFIIVDGYGREDQLKRVMGYSNAPFVAALRSRGFYVEDRSHSNYCQTQLSLTSTLNLSFLQSFPDRFSEPSVDRSALVSAMEHSFAATYLKGKGYKTIAVTSGFGQVQFVGDLNYTRQLDWTMFEDALLDLLPIDHTATPGLMAFRRRRILTGAFDNIRSASQISGPKFVIAHIVAPHPPFVFAPDGSAATQHGVSVGFADGSDYMNAGGTPQKYIQGYTGQVQWVNLELQRLIEAIIPKSGRQPIVLIEGDHGSKAGLNQSFIERTDLNECFSNLMALYVPDSVKKELYPGMTSVNTFRTILRGVFGEAIPLLPDQSYYSPFDHPYRFTEVTKRLER